MKKTTLGLVVVFAASSLLTSCAGQRTISGDSMAESLDRSDYQAIAARYVTPSGQVNYDKSNLLDMLEAGKALHDAGRWKESNEAFQLAEHKLAWKKDSIDTPEEVVNLIGTSLTNDTLGAYSGKIYEGGLINYYIALNTLMLGNEADTRVEFNRLEERQENAVRQLASYTKTVGAETQKGLLNANQFQAKNSYTGVGASAQQGLKDLPSGLSQAKIRNASGDIISATFRATSSARNDKNVGKINAMLHNASQSIASHEGQVVISQLGNTINADGGEIKNKVLVIYEDGHGPRFEEFRIDLPLFLVTSKVTYTGIALPKFKPGTQALGTIQANGTPTHIVTDLNQLEGLNFAKSYDGIVARAVVSTVVKTAAQAVANNAIDKKMGNSPIGTLLKIGTGAAQYALTKADLRVWANLPNTISVAVIDRPGDGHLSISNGRGGELTKITLPEGPNNIVLVRASGIAGMPAVYSQSLPALTPEGMTLLASKSEEK